MKSAVIYYSNSGNTERIAKEISKKFSSDMFFIAPKKPYGNFVSSVARVVFEKLSRKHPVSAFEPEDFSDYDLIFIGFPVWAGTMPEFMQDYIKRIGLKNKNIIPFVSAGGSGRESSLKTVQELLPENTISNYLFTSMKDKVDLNSWLDNIEYEFDL